MHIKAAIQGEEKPRINCWLPSKLFEVLRIHKRSFCSAQDTQAEVPQETEVAQAEVARAADVSKQ